MKNATFFCWMYICLLFIQSSFAQEVDGGNGHTIVLDAKGKVWCVGRNDHGQIGTGNYDNQIEPFCVNLKDVRTIGRGYDHTLAIDSAGVLWGWGNNRFGQLGLSNKKDYLIPVVINEELVFKACEGGYDHSIFLDEEGMVWAAGFNEQGELGRLNKENSHELQPVLNEKGIPLEGVVQIASVGSHALALNTKGYVYAWGVNHFGELGHFEKSIQPYAQKIEGLTGITSVAAGWGHSVALDSTGKVFVWGADPASYVLPNSGEKTNFYKGVTRMTDLPKIKKIACGSWHVLVLDELGYVWTWGKNKYGMLGNGSDKNSQKPVEMMQVDQVCEIGGGCFQSIVLDSSGLLHSSGDNLFGQLGLGNTERQLMPQTWELNSETVSETADIPFNLIMILLLSFGTIWVILYLLKNKNILKL